MKKYRNHQIYFRLNIDTVQTGDPRRCWLLLLNNIEIFMRKTKKSDTFVSDFFQKIVRAILVTQVRQCKICKRSRHYHIPTCSNRLLSHRP